MKRKQILPPNVFLLQIWKDSLWETMESAGKQEYEIALKRGNVDENGIAFITVIVDGGWSKRSFGHSYNALSGIVSIFLCFFSNST